MTNEIRYPRTLDSRGQEELSYMTAYHEEEIYIVCFGGVTTKVTATTYDFIDSLMSDDTYGTSNHLTLCSLTYYIKQVIHLNHMEVKQVNLSEEDISSLAHDLCYLYLILYQPDVEQPDDREEE